MIKNLQGSLVTQPIRYGRQKFTSCSCQYRTICAKIMKVGWQYSYCNNKQANFFGPPCLCSV